MMILTLCYPISQHHSMMLSQHHSMMLSQHSVTLSQHLTLTNAIRASDLSINDASNHHNCILARAFLSQHFVLVIPSYRATTIRFWHLCNCSFAPLPCALKDIGEVAATTANFSSKIHTGAFVAPMAPLLRKSKAATWHFLPPLKRQPKP